MATSSTDRVRQFRARQQAALEADPAAARLRDAGDLLAPAIGETLAALELGGKDAAAAKLAERFAAVIDEAKDPAHAMRWLGPELLKVLEALGATPAARVKAGRKRDPARVNKVAQLRAAHQRQTGRI